MRRRRLLLAAVLAAPAVTLASAGPAASDSGFVHVVTEPTPDSLSLYPGASTEQTFWAQNNYSAVAELRLQATNIVQTENGCAHAETLVDDCSDERGELGRWLKLSVLSQARDRPDHVIWSGSLAELQSGIALAPLVPAGGRPELRIVTTMGANAGNDTMTDRVTYDLTFTLTSSLGSRSSSLLMATSDKSVPPDDARSTSFVQKLDDPMIQLVTWPLLATAMVVNRLSRRRRTSP